MNKKEYERLYKITMYSLIIMMLISLACIPLTSAQSINIGDYPVTVEQDTCFNLPFTCDNCTFVNVTIAYPNGTIVYDNQEMTSDGGFFYTYSFCNTSVLGKYFAGYHYDTDGLYLDSQLDWFRVTPNGEIATEGNAIMYIGLLFLFVICLLLSMYSFYNSSSLLMRVGMVGSIYLFAIAISFVGWNMSSDFITSAPFIISMFRIIFFVLMAGVIPMIVAGFIYYLIMLFKIKEIEGLMSKGFEFDEAEHRSRRNKW